MINAEEEVRLLTKINTSKLRIHVFCKKTARKATFSEQTPRRRKLFKGDGV